MQKSFVIQVQEHVLALLTSRTPFQNYYHDVAHTKEVVAAATEIGKGEQLNDGELEIIQIAAWFHDAGYIEKTLGHEKISEKIAKDFLNSVKYPFVKIQKVSSCIKSTKVPQKPKNKLEKIICDADLSHLGLVTFFERNDKYRIEFENYLGQKMDDGKWLKKSISFMKRHRFFTKYALKNYSAQKKLNLQILQSQLKLLSQ